MLTNTNMNSNIHVRCSFGIRSLNVYSA